MAAKTLNFTFCMPNFFHECEGKGKIIPYNIILLNELVCL